MQSPAQGFGRVIHDSIEPKERKPKEMKQTCPKKHISAARHEYRSFEIQADIRAYID
jgi:hypothetical protein